MQVERIISEMLPNKWTLPFKFEYAKLRDRLEPEIAYLPLLLKNKCRRAIDVGANYGFYSYALSKYFNRVEAFEPQIWCTEDLSNYAAHSKNISVYNVGLSSFSTTLKLQIPKAEGDFTLSVSGAGNLITGLASFSAHSMPDNLDFFVLDVPVTCLDDYKFDDVDFIKIDVEGHELDVLKGSLQTIEKNKPILLVEIEQRHLGQVPIASVMAFLTDLGYYSYYLSNNQLKSTQDVMDSLVIPGTASIFPPRNFFFIQE